jgi:ribonuclease J
LPGLGRAKIKAEDFPTLKQKAIVLMRTTMIPVVGRIPGIKGSKLVYSLWDGYLKKNNRDTRTFKAFIDRYALDLEHVHSSGHATVDKLKEFTTALAPRHVIPIHTQFPEHYKSISQNVIEISDGRAFDLSAL